MQKQINIKRTLLILIIASVVIRGVLAAILELTNDEVNYWLYAMYPAISHYEHPPMVGFFIQASTLNLLYENEFFLRLSSVLLGGFNTYIIYLIGKKLKDELTGLFTAILYTTSLYCFVITGVFIHPDTPMVFFWLISLYYLIDGLFSRQVKGFNKSILVAGIFIGLGMLSKYIILNLWAAVFIYLILYDRKWLKRKDLYLSVIISILVFLPVIIWNLQNELKTVSFWDEQIKMLKSGLKINFFFQELSGQIFYNNPVNFILIISAIIAFAKKKIALNNISRFLLICGIPLALFILLISFFGRTLPHWSGGGYLSLIIIAAVYLSSKHTQIPRSIKLSVLISAIFIIAGLAMIFYLPFGGKTELKVKAEELGKNDITLDMYGWKQASEKFRTIDEKLVKEGKMKSGAPVFSDKWYNAGHIDYYIARPIGKSLFAVGSLSEIRKYKWVNESRGGYENIEEAYYITPSRDYRDPRIDCGKIFSIIVPMDTIRIERNGIIAENIFVFVMKK